MAKKQDREKIKLIRGLRDKKVRVHLEQYAPVWLVDEDVLPDDEVVRFNVVFVHPRYGWVNRRYRYDAFNDVLYYQGQTRVTEVEALALEEEKPYIDAEAINTVNSYGG